MNKIILKLVNMLYLKIKHKKINFKQIKMQSNSKNEEEINILDFNKNSFRKNDGVFYFAQNENEAFQLNDKICQLDKLRTLSDAVFRIKSGKNIGTGFYMAIRMNNKPVNVIASCSHVIDPKSNILTIYTHFNGKDNHSDIYIKNYKRVVINKPKIDFYCLEVVPEDEISFTTILTPEDYTYPCLEEIYKNRELTILQHPKGEENCCISFGLIKEINYESYEMGYNASTDNGSSGSPVIMWRNQEFKVIGIHKRGEWELKQGALNYGCILRNVLQMINNEPIIFPQNSMKNIFALNLEKITARLSKLFFSSNECIENGLEEYESLKDKYTFQFQGITGNLNTITINYKKPGEIKADEYNASLRVIGLICKSTDEKYEAKIEDAIKKASHNLQVLAHIEQKQNQNCAFFLKLERDVRLPKIFDELEIELGSKNIINIYGFFSSYKPKFNNEKEYLYTKMAKRFILNYFSKDNQEININILKFSVGSNKNLWAHIFFNLLHE